MKKIYFLSMLLIPISCLSSCSVIAGIFKAGMVVGIILIIVVVALILWIASMFRK